MRPSPDICLGGFAAGRKWCASAGSSTNHRSSATKELSLLCGFGPTRIIMTGKKPLITNPTLKTTEPGVPIYENLVIGNFLYALGLKIGARQHDDLAPDLTENLANRSVAPSTYSRAYWKFESIPLQRRVRCEPVSRENSPSYVEKPRFPAGVRAGASGAVDRDAQGPATSR